MKQLFLLTLLALVPTLGFSQESDTTVESRLEAIEGKLDDIELTQALNKLRFSGSFMNQYESFYETNRDTGAFDTIQGAGGGNPDQGQDSTISAYIMRVALNFDVAVSKKLHFYSTLGMSKFWNMSGRTTRTGGDNDNFQSLGGGYAMEDSKAHFDVAYLLYQDLDNPWAFALGRMTTNNGPPLNQLDGIERSGTYPAMSYNVILDGAAIIYDFKKYMPKKNNLKTRLFYTPFLNVNRSSRFKNKVDPSGNGTEAVKTHASMVTLLTEYTNKNISGLKSLDLYHSYYTFDGFYDEVRQSPLTADVDYEGAVANTVYLGLKGIGNSGLNISYTYSHFLVRGDSVGELPSFNHLYSLNYKFDNKLNAGHIIGAEYIQNDDRKVPTDATTIHVNEFYNLTNGIGTHLFYTAPLGRTSIVRAGVMSYEQGESDLFYRDVESKATATYVRWKVFF
ncbi:MAG: hypothetical protein ACJAS4_003164 [Bacteriovoracaceae bacterium]|jgi:hypothetical protein